MNMLGMDQKIGNPRGSAICVMSEEDKDMFQKTDLNIVHPIVLENFLFHGLGFCL
jgi:hypothetical protein